MRITYTVEDDLLIDSAEIPLRPRHLCLLTGIENHNLALLGGLIAGLFPIPLQKGLSEHLRALVEDFSGVLLVNEGSLPESCAYVGPDPNRHLLFAKVKEELRLQTGVACDEGNALASYGLDRTFLDRRISRLSGGEKMKVALAIAFSMKRDCYVLHGVVPWLDKKGRDCLICEIRRAKSDGASVVLIEHESHMLREIIDEVVWFDGSRTHRDRLTPSSQVSLIEPTVAGAAEDLVRSFNSDRTLPVFELQSVVLKDHPLAEFKRTSPLLDRLSFRINEGECYALVGGNGTGKSTIAQIAFGIIKPDSGDVLCQGQPTRVLSRGQLISKICYVGQFPEQQIIVGNLSQARKMLSDQNNELAVAFIDRWLAVPKSTPVASLSVLQKKILCLALLLTPSTKLVILDEPTWGLDMSGEISLFTALKDISEYVSFGLLVVSHDLSLVQAMRAKVLWLSNGTITGFSSVDASEFKDIAASEFGYSSQNPALNFYANTTQGS